MRITNKMMTNNMMSNINKNKLNMNTLEEQYSSGKKIQRPSDDPIVAVRALKLRTSLSELSQYHDKNIPDAQSWMDVTESALSTVNSIISSVNTYCVQGSTDTLTATDRNSISQNLMQLKNQIYQEGNTSYAGRYVFTGFKTDSALTFTEDADSLSYNITQNFEGSDIQVINKVVDTYELSDYDNAGETFEAAPQQKEVYRMQLGYDNLSSTPPDSIKYSKDDGTGTLVEQSPIAGPFDKYLSTDANAYKLTNGSDVHYIADTGEIIMGSDVYNELRTADKIQIDYTKTGFKSGELKPEHYFTCTMTDNNKPEQDPITYKKTDEGQKIEYEVNYNQKLAVNTEGSDAITHDLGRTIDYIISTVNDVTSVESKISEVEKRLKDSTLSDAEVKKYNGLKSQLETERDLKKKIMQNAFETGVKASASEQDKVNAAVADMGSREVRLQLTQNRLSSQKVDFEDLLSNNEDADVVETYIKYGSAQTIYNASLNAAAKVVKNSLLDYL